MSCQSTRSRRKQWQINKTKNKAEIRIGPPTKKKLIYSRTGFQLACTACSASTCRARAIRLSMVGVGALGEDHAVYLRCTVLDRLHAKTENWKLSVIVGRVSGGAVPCFYRAINGSKGLFSLLCLEGFGKSILTISAVTVFTIACVIVVASSIIVVPISCREIRKSKY